MPSLDELIESGLTSSVMDDPARQRYADLLLARQRDEIERRQGDLARQINESTFGRGLGLSTVTRDLQSERERLRMEALTKATREAELAAYQAQQAALGQAAGIQLRRGGLQEQQAGRAQQESQFRRGLKSTEARGREQLIGGGLAGLAGGGLQAAGYIKGKTGKWPWEGGGGPTPPPEVLGPPVPGLNMEDIQAQAPMPGLEELATFGGAASPQYDPGDIGDFGGYTPSFDYSPGGSLYDPGDFGFDFGGFAPGLESLVEPWGAWTPSLEDIGFEY